MFVQCSESVPSDSGSVSVRRIEMPCNIPKAVLALMSKAEVKAFTDELRVEGDRLGRWNEMRAEPAAAPPPWPSPNAPPPKGPGDYVGKYRT